MGRKRAPPEKHKVDMGKKKKKKSFIVMEKRNHNFKWVLETCKKVYSECERIILEIFEHYLIVLTPDPVAFLSSDSQWRE